jgi:hypothetical protein
MRQKVFWLHTCILASGQSRSAFPDQLSKSAGFEYKSGEGLINEYDAQGENIDCDILSLFLGSLPDPVFHQGDQAKILLSRPDGKPYVIVPQPGK